MQNNMHLPNPTLAQFMSVNNTTHKMFQQIDAIGVEAVEQIKHLIPMPSDLSEERYVEFPNNGAITVKFPFYGVDSDKRVGVKRIIVKKNQDVCVECYTKNTTNTFRILDQLGTMEIVGLLDSILIHYGRV